MGPRSNHSIYLGESNVADQKGRALFIVDNSTSGWTGLRYLEEWTGISTGFDIATGYFEIGSLLALDGKWQDLEKIRILMGAEMTQRTQKALLEAVRSHAVDILDGSIEADKDKNPFLKGVPAILEALQSGQIECRVSFGDAFACRINFDIRVGPARNREIRAMHGNNFKVMS